MATCNNNGQKQYPGSLKNGEVIVMVVPFPAQGHLNQLLQLSCQLISSYGLPVHYIGSATHNRQAKIRANGLSPVDIAKIHFHDVSIPPFPCPPPNPNAPSGKFPAHQQPSWEAILHLREPVAAILKDISLKSRRIVIIHDPLMAGVVQEAAVIQNAESYVFNCLSAFALFHIKWEGIGKPPGFIDAEPKGLPSVQGCATDWARKFAAAQYKHLNFQSGNIYNTCRLIEGAYLDLLTREEFSGKKKQWAIGPVLPVRSHNLKIQRKCFEWLDKQAPKSVIYVSFGTSTSMTDQEVKELAIGLEQSKSKFIWVLRDADKGDIFDEGEEVRRLALPGGYEERVKGYGIIVRNWAPQPEILAHPATGGFMSHCGWNSCIESITMGVPIAAWPMHSDQAWNILLITDVLKVGLVVREWARRDEPMSSATIANSVKRLMASPEGDKIRKRAEEIGDGVRRSTDEGGVSRLEMDAFITHITR